MHFIYFFRLFSKTIILLLYTCNFYLNVLTGLPLWTWECVNEKCVPISVKEKSKLQSLATCNMLCASMQIWPQPTGQVSLSTTAVPVRTDLIQLQIISSPSPPEVTRNHIEDAFMLLRNDLKAIERKEHGFEAWRSVQVRVNLTGSGDPRMQMNTDEKYRLALRPKTSPGIALVADIFAQSFCGVRHAFETFSQLIWLDPYRGTLLILEAAKIEDAPRFSYRGLLLDTARNFYPVTDILRTIDAMGASKLNTLHWHASDSQSFSLQLNSVPQLSIHGAYGLSAMYTPDDIRAVVRRARLRGVRVIIEIDTPAHVGRAWGWGEASGMRTLAHCIDAEPWSAYCNDPPCGQLNPRNPRVFEMLERIYAEIIQLTGVEDIFHIGNDDVSERCWEENFNDTDPMNLWLEYTRSALQRLEFANGKLPNLTLMWSSHLNERIKGDLKDFVRNIGLQSRNVAWAHKGVSGVRTVISHEDAWDLNSGLGAWHEESGGAPYNSWQRVYEYRPWARNAVWRVEGGEATVWSSSLSGGGLDGRIWPRAAALAERLWTDRAEGATRPVHARLDVHRSRLIERGIKASPIWSLWCTHNTYTCV
ncbi:hypothetical protein ABMA28_006144 [Loxostege sticticalis]|uniref:Beta-hexosaminidase n=1 Tax=Loxostege sticticalis TaxID=481309 RepID=A0ABD0SK64_LOXSC